VTVRVRGEDAATSGKWRAKLHLIDLAGSERLSKTRAQGKQLKEAQAINKSLSALGGVVAALGQRQAKSGSAAGGGSSGSGSSGGHIPFRNSKLTFLLQDSLSGSAKLLLLVNVSPVQWNADESMCSLQFAERCRAVQFGAVGKSGSADGGAAERQELALLRAEVAGLRAAKGVDGCIALPCD